LLSSPRSQTGARRGEERHEREKSAPIFSLSRGAPIALLPSIWPRNRNGCPSRAQTDRPDGRDHGAISGCPGAVRSCRHASPPHGQGPTPPGRIRRLNRRLGCPTPRCRHTPPPPPTHPRPSTSNPAARPGPDGPPAAPLRRRRPPPPARPPARREASARRARFAARRGPLSIRRRRTDVSGVAGGEQTVRFVSVDDCCPARRARFAARLGPLRGRASAPVAVGEASLSTGRIGRPDQSTPPSATPR
jgi:hypothetical protein